MTSLQLNGYHVFLTKNKGHYATEQIALKIHGMQEAKQLKERDFAKFKKVWKALCGVHCPLIENMNFLGLI